MIIISRNYFYRLNFKTNYRIRFFTTFIKKHVAEKITFFTNHYYFEYRKKNKKNIYYKDKITTTPVWQNRIVRYKIYKHIFRRRRKLFKKSLHYRNNFHQNALIFFKPSSIKIDPRLINLSFFFNNLVCKNTTMLLVFKRFNNEFFKIFHFFYNKIRNRRPIKNFSEFEFALKLSFVI